MHRILLPVDGSEAALHAVRHALELVGHGLRAQFVLANVQPNPNLYELVVAHDPTVLQQVAEATARDLWKAPLDLLRAAGQQVETVVVVGDAAQGLLELIETHRCHAVIMGSRGMGGLRSALLGSVSHALAQQAGVPVTLVRLNEED